MIPWEIYSYLRVFVGMKDFFDLHLDRDLKEKADRIYESKPKEFSITKMVRTFFDLEPEVPLNRYSIEFSSGDYNAAREIFRSMNLHEGRTVFMVTSGYNYPMKHLRDFFIKLGERFRESGFDIVTNSQTQELPNVPNIFLPIFQSIVFTQLCGNVVSIPTGWCEASCAFSSKPIKLSVIIPSVHDQCRIPLKEFIKQLKIYGDDFIDIEFQQYLSFCDQIFPNGVRYQLHKFIESEIEEQKLIEEIVENISR